MVVVLSSLIDEGWLAQNEDEQFHTHTKTRTDRTIELGGLSRLQPSPALPCEDSLSGGWCGHFLRRLRKFCSRY